MASVKRYRHVGSRIMETIEPNDGDYVLASDYDRLVTVCRELMREGDYYHDSNAPCDNECGWEMIKAKVLAIIGEGGEESK